MSTYILLKYLPDLSAGSETTLEGSSCCFRSHLGDLIAVFTNEVVENNPEWFKLKEEKVWTDSDMIRFGNYFDSLDNTSVESAFAIYKKDNIKI